MKIDEVYMVQALKEAEKAAAEDEVPVGCVIVWEKKVIARAHNQTRRLLDPTAHAEMIALTQACAFLKSERLPKAWVYVTIEPCTMCAGALVLARINRLVFAARDPKAGACGSVINIAYHPKLNHRIKITKGVLERECASLLSEFFRKKRTSMM